MPRPGNKICAESGCPKMVPIGTRRCEAHKRIGKYPDRSGTSRTGTTRHIANRKEILKRQPDCRIGYPDICTGISTDADHIVALSQGGTDDLSNLQGACRRCHLRKASLEGHEARGHNVTLPKPSAPPEQPPTVPRRIETWPSDDGAGDSWDGNHGGYWPV
jgi:5-methylcytosine-specific restriction protein A